MARLPLALDLPLYDRTSGFNVYQHDLTSAPNPH